MTECPPWSRPAHPLSLEQYLGEEGEADMKHEYVDGFAYAMAGGTVAHGEIADPPEDTCGSAR